MRSILGNIVHFATEKTMAFLLLAFAGGVASIPAQAQAGIWHLDAEKSIARLSLGSGAQNLETGVARVSGDVIFQSSHSADPVVNFQIHGDKVGSEYSEIDFRSKRSMLTSSGEIAVIGDLSLVRVKRSVTPAEPNEAYHGAEYGDPVVYKDTREVTLVLPNAKFSTGQNGKIGLSTTLTIGREFFPQLVAAVAPGNWPSVVVEDENCSLPSTIGEDFSGTICTGLPVTTVVDTAQLGSESAGREDYSGYKPAFAPNGNVATIALNLTLSSESSAAVAQSTKTAQR